MAGTAHERMVARLGLPGHGLLPRRRLANHPWDRAGPRTVDDLADKARPPECSVGLERKCRELGEFARSVACGRIGNMRGHG